MSVAPLVGAWIEIYIKDRVLVLVVSLPLWERGLKFTSIRKGIEGSRVAPLVGAWIEITAGSSRFLEAQCRSPCGSVD